VSSLESLLNSLLKPKSAILMFISLSSNKFSACHTQTLHKKSSSIMHSIKHRTETIFFNISIIAALTDSNICTLQRTLYIQDKSPGVFWNLLELSNPLTIFLISFNWQTSRKFAHTHTHTRLTALFPGLPG